MYAFFRILFKSALIEKEKKRKKERKILEQNKWYPRLFFLALFVYMNQRKSKARELKKKSKSNEYPILCIYLNNIFYLIVEPKNRILILLINIPYIFIFRILMNKL